MQHSHSIKRIEVNHSSLSKDRKLLFLDEQNHLHLQWGLERRNTRVAEEVKDFKWHPILDLFVYLTEKHLHICYSPEALFLEKDLANHSISTHNLATSNARLVDFHGSMLETCASKTSMRQNFSLCEQATSILNLLSQASNNRKILKSCRFFNSQLCWAVLASRALHSSDFPTAEVALAALNLTDKVKMLCHIQSQQDPLTKQIEASLLLKKRQQGQNLLKQINHPFLLVRHHVRSFEFESAYNKAHEFGKENRDVKWLEDYVLLKRKRFVDETCEGKEFLPVFKTNGAVLNMEQVKQKKNELRSQ